MKVNLGWQPRLDPYPTPWPESSAYGGIPCPHPHSVAFRRLKSTPSGESNGLWDLVKWALIAHICVFRTALIGYAAKRTVG